MTLIRICNLIFWFLLLRSSLAQRRTTATARPQSTATANTSSPRPVGDWISPEYTWIFQFPLPVPPVKERTFNYKHSSGMYIDYYDIEIKPFKKRVYPDLGEAEFVGYDGITPGPTLKMTRGREAVVRFRNNGNKEIAVHVHGQYNRAPFDGWASDLAKPGEYKDYYYPNSQNSRTIWYHDHAAWTTADGAYFGQAAFYLLTDPEDEKLGLPSGDYDIGMALESKMYNHDGTLRFETNNNTGLWGDVIQVNGQPWPYVTVEPRKYRIRLLNGAISRAFQLTFTADEGDGAPISFNVISSDCGLLAYPVESDSITMSMGERYDIVIDFSGFRGQNITLNNARAVADSPDYAATNYVARFVVGTKVTNWDNNGDLPGTLRDIPSIPETTEVTKDFTFQRVDGEWLINGVGFADVENRILAKPEYGAVERWNIKNGGPGTHPVHIHLVDFKVLSRTGGRNAVLPYEAAGMKDTVYLTGGESVELVATYAPWAGVYMFHCHNLIHEDHQMLTAINITTLSKWGYDNKTQFIDPMQEEFRPKAFRDDDFNEDSIMDKMEWFYNTEAYGPGTNRGDDPGEEDDEDGEGEETDTVSASATRTTADKPSATSANTSRTTWPAASTDRTKASETPAQTTDTSSNDNNNDDNTNDNNNGTPLPTPSEAPAPTTKASETPAQTTDTSSNDNNNATPPPTTSEAPTPTTTSCNLPWHTDHQRDWDSDSDSDNDSDGSHDWHSGWGNRWWPSSTLQTLTRSMEKPFIGTRTPLPRGAYATPGPRPDRGEKKWFGGPWRGGHPHP